MERIWPSLQGIDGSSGALGGAVNRTLDTLIPFVIEAPADQEARSKWLDPFDIYEREVLARHKWFPYPSGNLLPLYFTGEPRPCSTLEDGQHARRQ